MSGDQPPTSSGDAEKSPQPADRHSDRSPDSSASQDRASPPAGDTPGSGRSRAEYAASLRASGWHDQPPRQPPETSPSQADRPPGAASSGSPASDGQEGVPAHAPGRSQALKSTETPADTRDSDGPAHQEHASQIREQDLPARTVPPPDSRQPERSQEGTPERTVPAGRGPAADQATRQPGSGDPGGDVPDTGAAWPETGTGPAPPGHPQAAEARDQVRRADYAAELRADDPWRAGNALADDPAGERASSASELRAESSRQDLTEPRGLESFASDTHDTNSKSVADTPTAPDDQHIPRPGDATAGHFARPDTQPAEPGHDSPGHVTRQIEDSQQGRHPSSPADADRANTASGRESQHPRSGNDLPGFSAAPDTAGQPAGRNRDEAGAGQEDAQHRKQDLGDTRWPTQADRDRGHALYQEFLNDARTGRDQGTDVVGDKPDRSPGDTSDLPPAGRKLLTMENDDASRSEKLRRNLFEFADNVQDVTDAGIQTVQDIMSRPSPTGSRR